jgi:hypothetical protein
LSLKVSFFAFIVLLATVAMSPATNMNPIPTDLDAIMNTKTPIMPIITDTIIAGNIFYTIPG